MKIVQPVSKINVALLSMLFYVGSPSWAQAETPTLPAVKSTVSSTLLKEADAGYKQYAASTGDYFKFDPAMKSWPCDVSQRQLRQWTDIIDSADLQKTAKRPHKESTSTATTASPKFGYSYENVVFHPVSATCKNGKLDGNVEFIYEGTRKAWGPTYQKTSHEVAKVTMRIEGGHPVHLLELKKSVSGDQASNNQAANQKPAMPSDTVNIRSTAVQYHHHRPSTATIVMAGGPNPMYFLKRPVANHRVEKTFYAGTDLMSVETQDKAGLNDGLALSYKDGQAVKTCFKHGRQIDLKSCNG